MSERSSEDNSKETQELSISFEQWAEVAALLLERTSKERLRILERFSIDPEVWREADLWYSARLAEEIGKGIFERADVYAQHCVKAAKARAEAKPNKGGEARSGAPKALGSTAMAFDITKFGPALPFKPELPAAQALASAEWHAALQGKASGKPAQPIAMTEDVRVIAEPILPFEAENASGDIAVDIPPPEEFPLERYASLCVELDMEPERALEVLARYGVKPEQKKPLDAFWAGRFEGDAGQRQAFQQAKTVYVEWLMKMRRGR